MGRRFGRSVTIHGKTYPQRTRKQMHSRVWQVMFGTLGETAYQLGPRLVCGLACRVPAQESMEFKTKSQNCKVENLKLRPVFAHFVGRTGCTPARVHRDPNSHPSSQIGGHRAILHGARIHGGVGTWAWQVANLVGCTGQAGATTKRGPKDLVGP